MGKRMTPDTPVEDRDGNIPPDPPPQSQAEGRQLGPTSFPGLFRQMAPMKRQARPIGPSHLRNEITFRLDSKDASQPVTSFETNPRQLNPRSSKDLPEVNRTLLPSPELREPAKKIEVPVTSAAPVLRMSALPEATQKKIATPSNITNPVIPFVLVQASTSSSLGAPKAEPVPSASLPSPPPEIVEEKLAVSSKTTKANPVEPAVKAQAWASPSLAALRALPVPSASLPIHPLEIVKEKLAASPNANKAAPAVRVVEAQALASASLGTATAMPVPSAPLQAPTLDILLAQTQQWVPIPAPASQIEGGVGQLIAFSNTDKAGWEHLVGYYLQESNRTPHQVAYKTIDGLPVHKPVPGLGQWSRDWRKVDEWEKYPTVVDRWPIPTVGSIVAHLLTQIQSGFRQAILEEAIRRWAMSNIYSVEGVVRRAGYMLKGDRPQEFMVMSDIKKMPEGPEKEQKVAQARRESPRFAEECMNDEYCGIHKITKRSRGDDGIEVEKEFGVYTTATSRREVPFTSTSKSDDESPRKKLKMREPRPTQFHSVPLEERAIDSKGQRLPWSLEWHPDHPNARHQKRHHEETGPFGKRVRRRGSRSTTPAKKENPTLDGFEKALQYDQERAAAEAQEKSSTSKPHNESVSTIPSSIKVPTEVVLYGFAPGTHWDSINHYEGASGGYICEDYDRDPPIERRRFPNALAAAQRVRARALTRQEAVLARQYHGGNCWLKVTFDSAESADRAIQCSPYLSRGHWVWAELFRGVPPNHPDEPIPLRPEDMGRGPFGRPAPAPRVSRSLGSSFAQNNKLQTRSLATLSNSFTGTSMVQVDSQGPRDVPSQSSSTATSATATAPEHSDVRNRVINQPAQNARPPQRDPRFFTHFPDVPRTVLRPPEEAFLPQPTYAESWIQWLSAKGLLPGDMIGNGPPFLDNGEFDWASASLYWKVFYWLDSHLWTNFCGTKDT